MIKKYRLIGMSNIVSCTGDFYLEEGTIVTSDGNIDEYRGIKCTVENGEHKGKVVILDIDELY